MSVKREYTPEEDAYLIEYHGKKTLQQMALALGLSPASITRRTRVLRNRAMACGDKKTVAKLQRSTEKFQTPKIYDGYEDVPYWMRQSVRNQFVPDGLHSRSEYAHEW